MQVPLWFCIVCPLVLGLLTPFLFNFGLTAAAEAIQHERVIGFDNQDPTTELLARTIFDHTQQALAAYATQSNLRYRLAAGVRLLRVRVWETSSSWAEYRP